MDNLTHAFTATACTHAVSRERPSGLTLAAAVLAANAMHSLLAMPLLAIGAALGARFVARRRGNGAPAPPFLPLLHPGPHVLRRAGLRGGLSQQAGRGSGH